MTNLQMTSVDDFMSSIDSEFTRLEAEEKRRAREERLLEIDKLHLSENSKQRLKQMIQ